MANRNIDNADASAEKLAQQQVGELGKAYENAANQAKKLKDNTLELTNGEKELVSLSKQLELSLANIVASKVLYNKENRTSAKINEELKNLEKSLLNHNKNRRDIQYEINDALLKEQNNINRTGALINSLNKEIADGKKILDDSEDRLIDLKYKNLEDREEKLLAIKAGNIGKIADLQDKIDQRSIEISKAMQDHRGFSDYLKDLEKEVKKQEILNELAIDKVEALENTERINDELKGDLETEIELLKKIKKQQDRKEVSDSIGKYLLNKFTGLLALLGLKNLVGTLFEADTHVTNMAETLGLSKDYVRDIRHGYVEFVKTIKDGSLSVTDMIEAQANLSKELGIAVIFADTELKTFNDLTKLMGVSNKAAATLNKLAKSTTDNTTKLNFEYEKYVTSALESAFLAGEQLHLHVSSKDILEDMGNLSAGILVKFQGNPKALGEAVIQAKKLGLSLEQVDKIGESLLNWESSIENELKAELLTGRELNLERARAAALFGDQASLMQEISSQIGTQKDFTNLNVLAQKSLAESFGLSRDEMADMLLQQEMINSNIKGADELTAKQRAIFAEQGGDLGEFIKKQGMQLSLQEKFTKSMDKLKQTVIDLVDGPFGKLLNGIITILNKTWVLNTLFIGISGMMGGIMLKNMMALGVSLARLVGLSAAEAAFTTTSASMRSFGIGAVIGLTAAGIAIASMNSKAAESAQKAQEVPDGIAPSSRGPFTITDNYGATAITTKGDGLAVSPNINRGSNNQQFYDYKKLEDKLEKLIAINQQQYEVAKGGNVIQINEFALGKAAPLASFKENSRTFY